MATRRQCLKRIKKRPLSERSEFRTLPVSGAGGACSPRAARTAIVGSPSLAYFSWRSKRSRSAAGPRPGLSPRQWTRNVSPARQAQHERLAVNATLSERQRRLRGCLAQADEATQPVLPDGLAGCPARRPGHFSCFAKRSNQEKATPEMAVRCADSTRRWHRNREASETRFAQTADASLSDFGTSDVSPSTGTPTATATEKATAKVAARSYKQPQPRPPVESSPEMCGPAPGVAGENADLQTAADLPL